MMSLSGNPLVHVASLALFSTLNWIDVDEKVPKMMAFDTMTLVIQVWMNCNKG